MAIEAERDAILKCVFSTLRLLNNVVQLDLETTEAMADATMAAARHKSVVSDFG